MNWRTHPWLIRARTLGRRVGINRLLAALRAGDEYEDRFRSQLLDSVGPGDCVWDVGANVGLYTKELAVRVRGGGAVVAFEPSPKNVNVLRRETSGLENVTVFQVALGAEDSQVSFRQGADSLGATSRIVHGAELDHGDVVRVVVQRGDRLVEAGEAPAPNVMKIDTEGHELDVLRGLGGLLRRPELRAVCVEVHFALLAGRGQPDAPAEIERLLAAAGFRIDWPDASHIVAKRSGA